MGELEDGTYTVEVELGGGSGRATITSPATLIVEEHKADICIEWSSSNYDYMVVQGTTYYPINEDGNSMFEIPVVSFDEQFEVIADTTAMSVPHEITYTILLDSKSIENQNNRLNMKWTSLQVAGIVVAVFLVVGVTWKIKKKRK